MGDGVGGDWAMTRVRPGRIRPHKIICEAEEDLPLYGWAQARAGDNVSAAVTCGPRRFVGMEDNHRHGYHEVTVCVHTGYGLRTHRFWGALLGEWPHLCEFGRVAVFRVHHTRKGPFADYVRHIGDGAMWVDLETGRAWSNAERPVEPTVAQVDLGGTHTHSGGCRAHVAGSGAAGVFRRVAGVC